MTRAVGIVLAVLFGVAAMLLVAGPVSASYPGGVASCSSVVNAAAVDDGPAPTKPRERLAAAACHDALVSRAEIVAVLALGAVIAGSAVVFGRRQPEYAISVSQPSSA